MSRPRGVPDDALFCPRCAVWMTGLQFIAKVTGESPTCPHCRGPVAARMMSAWRERWELVAFLLFLLVALAIVWAS